MYYIVVYNAYTHIHMYTIYILYTYILYSMYIYTIYSIYTYMYVCVCIHTHTHTIQSFFILGARDFAVTQIFNWSSLGVAA